MRNVKLTVQYEGTRYAGWQRQLGIVTVQEVLEEALEKLTGTRPTVTGSGRTDAGVHALGQVANFFTQSDLPPAVFVDGTNAHLPADVAVVDACEMPEWFNACRNAAGKTYRYSIFNSPVRPVLERNYVYHVREPLDFGAMKAASRHFVGAHDFAGYCSKADVEKNLVRTVFTVDWVERPPIADFFIEGNGFLYNMVRAIVGTLVEVGKGKRSPDAIPELIAARNRSDSGPTAPAHGLCLMSVAYSPIEERRS